jgi:hypothetical protein
MADEDTTEKPDYLTPKDIQKWALQEIADSTKAHELRVKDVTEFATAYALGELTPAQAEERFARHDHRWGEALPGASAVKNTTDEKILAAIDKGRGEFTPPEQLREEFQKRFGKRSERGGPPTR